MSAIDQVISMLPGDLGTDYCFLGFQRLNVDIVTRIQALFRLSSGLGWNVSATTPTKDQRLLPWFNLTDGRVYQYSNTWGKWISSRPFSFGQIWAPGAGAAESTLWSLDGGDGTDPRPTLPDGSINPSYSPPTPVTGATWMVLHQLDAKFPVGAGTFTNAGSAAIGTTAGADQLTLDITNIPSHTHYEVALDDVTGGPTPTSQLSESWPGVYSLAGSSKDATVARTSPTGGDPAAANATKPATLVPPFYAVYFVIPTARQYYTVDG